MQKFNGSLIRQFPSLVTGNAAAGVQVSVFIAGGNTLATLYATNNTAGAQLSNPLTTDSKGFYSFYAADGQYRLQFSNGYPALEVQLLDAVQTVSDINSGAGLLGQAASEAVQLINEANAQVQQSLDSLLTSVTGFENYVIQRQVDVDNTADQARAQIDAEVTGFENYVIQRQVDVDNTIKDLSIVMYLDDDDLSVTLAVGQNIIVGETSDSVTLALNANPCCL